MRHPEISQLIAFSLTRILHDGGAGERQECHESRVEAGRLSGLRSAGGGASRQPFSNQKCDPFKAVAERVFIDILAFKDCSIPLLLY